MRLCVSEHEHASTLLVLPRPVRYFRRLQKRYAPRGYPAAKAAQADAADSMQQQQEHRQGQSAADSSNQYPVICINLLRCNIQKRNELMLSEHFAEVSSLLSLYVCMLERHFQGPKYCRELSVPTHIHGHVELTYVFICCSAAERAAAAQGGPACAHTQLRLACLTKGLQGSRHRGGPVAGVAAACARVRNGIRLH